MVFISDVSAQRWYYGSEHGKGEANGETGVITQAVDRMVASNRLTVRNDPGQSPIPPATQLIKFVLWPKKEGVAGKKI